MLRDETICVYTSLVVGWLFFPPAELLCIYYHEFLCHFISQSLGILAFFPNSQESFTLEYPELISSCHQQAEYQC